MIFFKFPFNPNIYTINPDAGIDSVEFVSFDEKMSVGFRGKIKEISKEDLLKGEFFIHNLDIEAAEFNQEKQDKYEAKISKVIQFIKNENLKKLVISRRKILHYQDIPESGNISLTKTFLNLCENYPNAFTYFFNKDGQCWLGAFSEVLGKFNKKTSQFETMSLAGTLPVNETWTEKEIEEQKPVSDYILNILKNYSENIHQSETYDHNSGNIKHLRTDFKAKIERENLENLISELHPTPAVCGIPKDFCRKAIQHFENYNRELYAGYIRIENDDEIIYQVNLRCAQLAQNCAFIYVGGGITTQSNPEKEWRETELKSEAILKNIAIS